MKLTEVRAKKTPPVQNTEEVEAKKQAAFRKAATALSGIAPGKFNAHGATRVSAESEDKKKIMQVAAHDPGSGNFTDPFVFVYLRGYHDNLELKHILHTLKTSGLQIDPIPPQVHKKGYWNFIRIMI